MLVVNVRKHKDVVMEQFRSAEIALPEGAVDLVLVALDEAHLLREWPDGFDPEEWLSKVSEARLRALAYVTGEGAQ